MQNTRRLQEPPQQRTTFRSPDRHLAKPEKQAITRTRGGKMEDPRRVLITRRPRESYMTRQVTIETGEGRRPQQEDSCRKRANRG
jgi:hypothetical protein